MVVLSHKEDAQVATTQVSRPHPEVPDITGSTGFLINFKSLLTRGKVFGK